MTSTAESIRKAAQDAMKAHRVYATSCYELTEDMDCESVATILAAAHELMSGKISSLAEELYNIGINCGRLVANGIVSGEYDVEDVLAAVENGESFAS